MTNFERIKLMDINELSEFLNDFSWDIASEVFTKKFCDKCEPIIRTIEDSNYEREFAPCEFIGNACRFIEDGTISQEDYEDFVKWWLREESVK